MAPGAIRGAVAWTEAAAAEAPIEAAVVEAVGRAVEAGDIEAVTAEDVTADAAFPLRALETGAVSLVLAYEQGTDV